MSDYTPTTEEVRDAFAIRKWDNFQRNYPNSHDKTERDAERERFDRWLAQVKAEAWIEGYYACHQDYQRKSGPMLTPNPYREEEDQ